MVHVDGRCMGIYMSNGGGVGWMYIHGGCGRMSGRGVHGGCWGLGDEVYATIHTKN